MNPILQTENAVVGEVITGATVVALPLNGRNFAQLTLLAPGVQTHAPDELHRGEPDRVLGPPVRQRPARAEQQLHARRRRPERGGGQPDRLLPEPGRHRRDPRRHQQLLGRVRQRGRRRRERHHEVGHATSSTAARSMFARDDKLRRQLLGQQPLRGRRRATSSSRSSAAPCGGPLVKNKLFFFAELPGHPGRTGPARAPPRSLPRRGAGATSRACSRAARSSAIR